MRRIAPVLLVAGALLLAGCTADPGSTVTATRTVTASPSRSASPTPSSTPRTDPNAPKGQCADFALRTTVGAEPSGGAAGSSYYDVVFTNTGSASCVLSGYPGVSVVDASGKQLGAAAERTGPSPATQTLAAGAQVYAQVQVVNMSAGSSPIPNCTVLPSAGWSVYAPHSFARVVIPDSAVSGGGTVDACSNGPVFLHVTGPVRPGTHQQ